MPDEARVVDARNWQLRRVSVFTGLSMDSMAEIGQLCTWRRFSAHQTIIHQNDPSTDVYFLIDGHVRVVVYSASGREITFRDLVSGEIFGELAAIDKQPRSASVTATADSMIASMPASVFWDVLHNYEPVADALLKRLAELVRRLSDRVFESSALTVKSRIHAEILRLGRETGSTSVPVEITPAPTHAELASLVGTHREAVTRELNNLGRAGLIEQHGRSLVIHDLDGVAKLLAKALGIK